MTEEEQAAVNAENQPENTVAESPAAEKQSEPAAAAEADAAETDANNFGEDASDNFGGEAEAAAGFEDNFGLGEQQLSAGTIPSPPPAPKKKEPAPPVTPRNREPDAIAAPKRDENRLQDTRKSREDQLFEQFQLMRVPQKSCEYAMRFRTLLTQRPDALEKLEPMLCDEASVEAVRLGIRRLGAFPSPEFRNIVFYYPAGMATEPERKDWDAHLKKYPEYAELAKGKYPYFDPPQFFYRHGAIFLDKAVTDRLEGGVFYQCGAFCGASVIVMNQYKPEKIYAFEPSVGNTQFLQANVAHAGIKNAELYRLCIADREGKVVMPDRDREGKPCKTEAPVASLDIFEQKKTVKGRVAWIQADVNGMGLRVIRGAEKMIRRDKPLISVAIYHSPEEMFGIVPLLREWAPEYKFMVRRCQCNPRIPYTEITLIAYIPS
ncbi:MAG: FkbM family methyltransferase [Lentisphaeria bacterium]|nr:FkbM family methyltransferase [Lentisphaeria bacterium]